MSADGRCHHNHSDKKDLGLKFRQYIYGTLQRSLYLTPLYPAIGLSYIIWYHFIVAWQMQHVCKYYGCHIQTIESLTLHVTFRVRKPETFHPTFHVRRRSTCAGWSAFSQARPQRMRPPLQRKQKIPSTWRVSQGWPSAARLSVSPSTDGIDNNWLRLNSWKTNLQITQVSGLAVTSRIMLTGHRVGTFCWW